jgi:formylglycine-generating enzyme required for sulfatase activity
MARLSLIGLVALVLGGAGVAAADVFNMPTGQTSLLMVGVGDVGNVADITGYGSVAYAYNIGKYDVTAAQYVAFLNAVAKTDTYGLYNSFMATAGCQVITQTGSPGNYSYAVTTNGNFPVICVTWGDAARFCNWLTNGQPSGPEGNGTTETGLYALGGATSDGALMAITRSAGAGYAIPTENEWYKSAYYKGGNTGNLSAGYWSYPTQSSATPHNSLVLAGTDPDDANYWNNLTGGYTDPTYYLTAVGAFAACPGAYGTFDQGGDVWQWNEANISGSNRGVRGGMFSSTSAALSSSYRWDSHPADNVDFLGFRVSQIPEPASFVIFGLGVIGTLARRKSVGR